MLYNIHGHGTTDDDLAQTMVTATVARLLNNKPIMKHRKGSHAPGYKPAARLRL